MALGFIKKVFSFGRAKEAADETPAPSEAQDAIAGEDRGDLIAQDAPARSPPPAEPVPARSLDRQEFVAEESSLPPPTETSPVQAPADGASEGEMVFTPESPAADTPEPPEPEAETVETAGEAPIAAPDVEAHDVAPQPEPPAAPTGQGRFEGGSGISVAGSADAGPPDVEPEKPRASWFQRLRQGLARTSGQLTGQIGSVFTKRKLDEDTLQDLEDILIQADLGVETAMRVTDTLASGRYGKNIEASEVNAILASEIEKVLSPVARPLELDLKHKPHVILVVGVNGTGKTTTIGKLAAKLVRGGLKVTLAAGDTFRAAAIEQLRIWGERTGSDVISSKLGADAAGLAYEAYEKARANGSDVVIVDTAGRLQNKAELMAELEKVVRVLGKLDPDAPHTVLQTLDATTGQNALNQVEIFRNVAGVNGLVMTKLDGSARGGILVAIAARHKLPVYFVGVGEGIDDLEPFEAREFAAAIAGRSLD